MLVLLDATAQFGFIPLESRRQSDPHFGFGLLQNQYLSCVLELKQCGDIAK